MKTIREFTENEILTSKAYVKGVTSFNSPATIFKDLLEIDAENFELSVNGSHELININDDESENISFGRVDIKYKMIIDEEMHYNVGLIVALDKGKPIAKIYNGIHVTACTNMCIFGAEQIIRFDLSSTGDSYKEVFKSRFAETAKQVEKSRNIIRGLKSINLTAKEIHTLNGAILNQIVSENEIVGTNPIINGIKLQTTKSSKYYSKEGLNAWLYYNSLTEYLNEKVHILDIPEKALSVFRCLKDYLGIDINTFNYPSEQINFMESIKEIEIEEAVIVDKPKKKRKQEAI